MTLAEALSAVDALIGVAALLAVARLSLRVSDIAKDVSCMHARMHRVEAELQEADGADATH